MIRLHFTVDSKRGRRGEPTVAHARSLAAARKQIRCYSGKPDFSLNTGRHRIYGYPKSWEVTCGDTVVADALQLPRGAREDYYPRYKVSGRRR